MPADIALGKRAVNRVAQRMDADICIRMPRQAKLVRHIHPAQDHGTVGCHRVDVKPGTDTGNHGRS